MATPQIPFISAPLKKTDDVDWIHPLKKYIARVYQDDPEKYKEEVHSFNRLRQDIRGAGKDMTGRDLLYRYFGQLELLDLRFPVDEKHVKILFCWYDAFNNRSISQYSLAFEKASIIFNEAATLSAIASSQNRAEAEGRKRAFHYFQASSGMFQYINDNFLHAPSEDLSRETVNMLSELMLAQAQECFLESSIREKSKDGLIAKLASHTAWVYGNLVDGLGDALTRGVGLDKSWITLCQVKQKYYAATAQEHKAAACEAEGKYGESVARYAAAESAAREALKLTNTLTSAFLSSNHANGTIPTDAGAAIQELCKNKSATCTEKLTMATRDNDMIYHENVPQESILTPIDRLKAIKPIPIAELYGPDEMKKVIGADIFAKLIPLSVHESASLYSEEIAKLLRSESERCDIAKAELNASLDYMKLPGSLAKFKYQHQQQQQQQQKSLLRESVNSLLDHYAIPPSEVTTWADHIAVEERRSQVTDLIHTLTTLKTRAKQLLDEASLKLDTEMRDCEQNRVQYGDDWTQTPSSSLTSEFRHDITNHRRTLEGASQSDNQLISRYESARYNIDILKQGSQGRDLEKAYTQAIISILPNDKQKENKANLLDIDLGTEKEAASHLEEQVNHIEKIIEKLRKIESDRDETFRDLKEKTMQDDISQILILNKKANVEQHIFASELEKYRPHQQRITATIQHQQTVIKELTAAFKSLMEGEEARNLQLQYDKAERLRRNLTADFSEANSIYNEIREGLSKGIQFYSSMQDTIETLQRNIQRFITERTNERNRLIESIQNNKSAREQQLLRETLNKYATAPPLPPLQTHSSSSSLSQLTHQARHLSIHEPNAPYQTHYTPTPPPKPQAFIQQQQQQQPSTPYGMYSTTPIHQQPSYGFQQQVPQTQMQTIPPPSHPVMYNHQQPYQPQPPTGYSPQPQPQYQQQQQPYYSHPSNIQSPPYPPQQPHFPTRPPQQQQGYPPWQQPQWQQQQQQPQLQPQPQPQKPPGNLLD
ncbi:BRO1-like domain-containing protein [Cokeromyces recurvatus]|uniref:BRO1-like domain-containing protein n=1 Tax=Cokeromyces recurvatus TaxID=90255 RepID=UPI00221FB740|nr:BRO1-like domain-containing protein [Cokeromyces recurvatus]KAI7904258.1 BRO1-like domain-containing protein [Cokeromyces recurvatus]